jgi:putative two-component system hydrogenase maturation factor HypX/HoxX
MRILLVSTAFNSLSQRIYCETKALGHCVSVQFAHSDEAMLAAVQRFAPDLVICPFLTRYIPASIYETVPTFVVHPGIRGDKGPHSLDHALLEQKESWGVTLIRANGEFDGGDIYAAAEFAMRQSKKASLYRREVNSAASRAVKLLLEQWAKGTLQPVRQLPTQMHKVLTQSERRIDWQRDSTGTIIRKINAADSFPGVLESLMGAACYLYGAHKEEIGSDERLKEAYEKAALKEIFAKRDGAVCVKSIDGALWISHLKEPGRFKLPATYVLKEKLKGVREYRIPLMLEAKRETFHELYLEMKGEVAYLYFDFHNGAFNSEQSIRLKYAVESLRDRCKAVVLMGGEEFFSNGIHLNILEDSKKPGEDGWSNINAMNDMVRSVLLSDDFLTIAAFRGGAGAGGLFLGLACDYVVARRGVVLNPHYRTIGLSGSEFHTYTLPKRVGAEEAARLLEEALPVGTERAGEIGLVDVLLSEETDAFYSELDAFAQELVADEERWYELLESKRERLEQDAAIIASRHKEELDRMYPEFWEADSAFHGLRRAFVYKQCPTGTPERLIYTGERDA